MDCASIDVPIFAADARLGAGGAAGHTFGLAWIGHTLFGADNISPWFKDNADQCLTPANGNQRCGPTSAEGIGTEILGAFAPGPQAGIVSDFTYNGPNTAYPGSLLFASSLGSTVRVLNASDVQNMSVTPQFGGTFCFIDGRTCERATWRRVNRCNTLRNCRRSSRGRNRRNLPDRSSTVEGALGAIRTNVDGFIGQVAGVNANASCANSDETEFSETGTGAKPFCAD